MSTLRVTNVQDTAGANSLTTAQIYNGAAKAWVNFNAQIIAINNTGIRASFNVDIIEDNGLGDYTVKFKNPMPDANYSVVSGPVGVPAGSTVYEIAKLANQPPTPAGVRIITQYGQNAIKEAFDYTYNFVAVFR